MKHITISRWIAALAAAALSATVAVAQAPVEISFYYPVAVGGPITKIIDKFASGFREGKSRDQGPSDLFGHLPGFDHQGAHRRQEQRRADDVGAAVDRHVHADRRGCDRAVGSADQDGGGPGVAAGLLSGVHGKQPDRRQDLGHSVPALDDRALLQQGNVQGSGTRSQPSARDVEGNGRVRAEADQARCFGEGHAVGRADPGVRVSLLAVPGTDDRKRRAADECRGNRDLLRQARGDRSGCNTGST